MMAKRLSEEQVAAELSSLIHWKLESGEIVRQLTFPNFVDAMIFINGVAQLAEEEGHHPDIRVVYNRVTLALSTHDAGGLTSRDFKLARRIDALL
jgi:4a-hydroxytetrahydrobiopterin dehydratase